MSTTRYFIVVTQVSYIRTWPLSPRRPGHDVRGAGHPSFREARIHRALRRRRRLEHNLTPCLPPGTRP